MELEPTIASTGLLLLVVSLVAMLSRRLSLPYSVGLVVAGIALAFSPLEVPFRLSRDLIFEVFLPPLVFEAALHLKWPAFKRDLPLTAVLAFVGVIITTGVVAAGMHYALGWSWVGAGLFGVLIAATDPVSVIAAFKEMKVEPRLAMIVESESLLNDGAAAVGFALLAAFAMGEAMTPAGIAGELAWTVFAGIGIGAGVAWALMLIAGRTEDHLVEITLTTIAAYGSFMAAESVHASGVLASLAAGILIGNFGWIRAISEGGRAHVISFWEYIAFLANSMVFILIGGREAEQSLLPVLGAAAIATGLMLAGRALAVYPLSALFARSRLKIAASYQHVLFWGGLRGALALALALALPIEVIERDRIISVAFAVVAFSIFVQGLTMPGLIRRLGLIRPPAD